MKYLPFYLLLTLSINLCHSQELETVKCKGVYTQHLTSNAIADYLISRSGVNKIFLQKVSRSGAIQKCELANGLQKKCIGVFVRNEQIHSVLYYASSHKVTVEIYDLDLKKREHFIEIGTFQPNKQKLDVAERVYFHTSKNGFIIVRDDSKKTQNVFTSLTYLFDNAESSLESISFETSKSLHVKDFKADDQLNILFILESDIPVDGFKNETILNNYQSYLMIKPLKQEFKQKELSVKKSVRTFNAAFKNDHIYIAGIKYTQPSQIIEGYMISLLKIQNPEDVKTTFIPHKNYSLEKAWGYESVEIASSYEKAQSSSIITKEQKLRDICVLDLTIVDSNNVLLICYEHSKCLVGDGGPESSSTPCFRDYQFTYLNLENKSVNWWTKISNYEVNTIAGPYTTTNPFRTWGYKSAFLIRHKGLFPLSSNPLSFLLADTRNHYSSDGIHLNDHDIGKSMVAQPVTSLLKLAKGSGNLTINCLVNQNTEKIKSGLFYSIIERSFIKNSTAYIPYQHSFSMKLMFLKVEISK